MPLSWTVHPARERPAAGLGLLALSGLIAFGACDWMGSPWWGVFAAAVVVGSLRRFLLPTQYRLDTDGISSRFLGRTEHIRWADVRRFHFDNQGAFISTRSQPSVMDAYRGLHLTFCGNANEVAAFVREHVTDPDCVRTSQPTRGACPIR